MPAPKAATPKIIMKATAARASPSRPAEERCCGRARGVGEATVWWPAAVDSGAGRCWPGLKSDAMVVISNILNNAVRSVGSTAAGRRLVDNQRACATAQARLRVYVAGLKPMRETAGQRRGWEHDGRQEVLHRAGRQRIHRPAGRARPQA